MASLGRVVRLLARAAAWSALVAVVSVALGGVLLRALTAAAAGALRIVDRPVVLTSLASRGDRVVIGTHLTGLEQPLATWDATNLPIFVVATLGLALAAPASSPRRRAQVVLAAIVASTVTMVATIALQLQVTAVDAARTRFGLRLYDRRDEALLASVNEGIGVAMLLVPAAVFAFAYLRFRADVTAAGPFAPAGSVENAAAEVVRRRRGAGVAVVAGAAAIGLGALAAVGSAPVDPRPGLVRVVQLNPGMPRAHVALAAYDALATVRRR